MGDDGEGIGGLERSRRLAFEQTQGSRDAGVEVHVRVVLHYPALFVQLGLVDCAHHVTHPIRFHPEQEIQRIFGRVLESARSKGKKAEPSADVRAYLDELRRVIPRDPETPSHARYVLPPHVVQSFTKYEEHRLHAAAGR